MNNEIQVKRLIVTVLCFFAWTAFSPLPAQTGVPTPESVLGQKPGADFYLARYDESLRYFQQLDAASDKIQLVRVGETSGGLDWYLALISSPENLANLERYKEIARRLARAEGLSDDEARALAQEGRAIVHIDGGLHSTEVAHAQHTIQLTYDLVSATDPETLKLLDDVILILWFSINPDGQNMVVDWYRRNLGTPYEVSAMPRLYQKYVGHDNNRDGYMNNMIESQVVTRTTLEYNPQVFYNHHQTAPFPARIWIPPFAEPVSSNVHPLMWRWVNVFGTSMAAYLEDRDMPGAIHRGRGFDDWYPGFIDHVNSFRNTISFLTETALYRYATPHFYTLRDFPRDRQDLRAEVMYASPWKGGWWRLGDAVRYMLGASLSVIQTASKYRVEVQYNRYQAGRDTIQRFEQEPPFAYLIPSRQRDLHTAAVLVDKLITNGIRVHRANADFTLEGVNYPAGSWVVLMQQPHATLVKELFEIQDYPDLRDFPEGPPDQPYDVAGWTLPLQMGVEVVQASHPLDDRFASVLTEVSRAELPAGGLQGSGEVYTLPYQANAAVPVVNAALRAGANVSLQTGDSGARLAFGGAATDTLRGLASEHHFQLRGAASGSGISLRAPRVGLYRPWAASMDEGWTRWLLENNEFDFLSLYNNDILKGHLKDRVDVIVIADIRGRSILEGHQPGTVPPEFAGGLGQTGVDYLKKFVDEGGTLVTFNQASRFAIEQFNLAVNDAVSGLRRTEFFCSGSLLRTEVKASDHLVTAGIVSEPVVMFHQGPVFDPKASFKGTILLSYPEKDNPLMSGYLLGPGKMQGKAALLDAEYGQGHIILFGFKPQWRGQTHGTYRLFFNSLFYFGETAQTVSEEGETAFNLQLNIWDDLRGEINADLSRLIDQAKAFQMATGQEALQASNALKSSIQAFEKTRLSALAELTQASSGAARQALRRYRVKLKGAVSSLAGRELGAISYSAGDLVSEFELADLEKEISQALTRR